jgi:hypothetical protein
VNVHHGDEAGKTKNGEKRLPLPGAPNVEVVLRHFHRCRYRSSLLWFFCWRGTDRSGSWLSGNTVDTKIYVVRVAGA